MQMQTVIGKRLVELRTKNNMTQEKFAENIGVSRQAVSKWETDKGIPDIDNLILIAEMYHVSLDYLLKGEDINKGSDIGQNDEQQTIIEQGKTAEIHRLNMSVLVCIVIIGIWTMVSLFVTILGLYHMVWDKSAGHKTLARVDEISWQYSIAKVSADTASGNVIKDTIILDTDNIHEGDYIYAYVSENENRITVEYETPAIIMMIGLIILQLIVLILLIREIRKR